MIMAIKLPKMATQAMTRWPKGHSRSIWLHPGNVGHKYGRPIVGHRYKMALGLCVLWLELKLVGIGEILCIFLFDSTGLYTVS